MRVSYRQRYRRRLSRETAKNYREGGIGKLPREDDRHVKVVRATSLSYSKTERGLPDFSVSIITTWQSEGSLYRVREEAEGNPDAENACGLRAVVTYLYRVRVLPTSLPMKQ